MQIEITNKHRYQQYANQSLYWLGTDTQELWHTNMQDPDRRAHLEKYGFDNPMAVVYQMNSHGFRCKEFDQSSGFIALGCSHTCGIGLPESQTWPSIVAQSTGLTAWNLGIGGGSLDTCFRMLYNYIDRLSPQFVMLLIPEIERFELHHLGFPKTLLHSSSDSNPNIEEIKKIWVSDEQNSATNRVKNLLAVQQLCDTRGIRLIAKPLKFNLVGLGLRAVPDKWAAGRDLMHSGYLDHQYCAGKFLEELNQN
jgi:hypothetical protein